MPTIIVTDPQLASYLGIEVGGLALDQRDEGGGVIGLHGAPSSLPLVAYTADAATAIINSLPSLARLSSKLSILRALMSTDGALGADYTSDPSRHPLYGDLYATYLEDEVDGDLAAAAWPGEAGTGADTYVVPGYVQSGYVL